MYRPANQQKDAQMTTLTLDLPPDLLERLRSAAAQQQKPVDAVVRDWIEERLPPPKAASHRDTTRAALQTAGLLTEPGPHMKQRAARSKATLDEVRASLDRAGGKPLSEVVLEMRGPEE
jgi:plasmid stability protein